MKKEVLIAFSTLFLLIFVTIAVIFYGRGYRAVFNDGKIDFTGSGLLVATSKPDGAGVFVNGQLTTATDNTINLAPGEYTIRIFKDGYFPWEKKLIIKKEVVTKADALLFPNAPKLESITNIGVRNPVLDPSQTKLAYAVASQSAVRNGIYILDLTTRPILTLQSSSSQIVDDSIDFFSNSTFEWSPDGSELIATVSGSLTYLLSADRFNQSPADVSATLQSLDLTWQAEKKDKENARIAALPKRLREVVKTNFNILEWSLDDSKILYEASISAQLPIIIKPRLIGSGAIPEIRTLKKNSLYVYDAKEDKNFEILSSKTPKEFSLHFFPDSDHLIYVHDEKVEIMEYDGSNLTTIYAGPFVNGFVFPWPDASKIVILTNLGNPNIDPNLYTIVLK